MIAKRLKNLLVVAGLVMTASTVMAQQPSVVGEPDPSLSMADKIDVPSKNKKANGFDTITKMFSPPPSNDADKNVTLVEGLDARAWATVLDREKRKSTQPTGEMHEVKLHLSWAF